MLSTSTRPAQVKLVSLSSSSRFGSVVFLETTHTHIHTLEETEEAHGNLKGERQ